MKILSDKLNWMREVVLVFVSHLTKKGLKNNHIVAHKVLILFYALVHSMFHIVLYQTSHEEIDMAVWGYAMVHTVLRRDQ